MGKSTENVKTPKKRKNGKGRGKGSSTGMKVLAGGGGALGTYALLSYLRKYLVDNKHDPRIAGIVATLANAIGAAATSDWLRALFIGNTIASGLALSIDEWTAMKANSAAAKLKEQKAQKKLEGPPANADKNTQQLIAAVKAELQKQLAANDAGQPGGKALPRNAMLRSQVMRRT